LIDAILTRASPLHMRRCCFRNIFALLLAVSPAHAGVTLSASATAPVTGPGDQFNFINDANIPGTTPFNFNSEAFSDNAGPPGQTFTTGSGGPFTLNAFSLQGANTGAGNIGGNVTSGTWGIRVSAVTGTTLAPLTTVTGIASPATLAGNEWLTWTFSGADAVTLLPSTTYAVEVFSSQGYYGFDAALDPGSYPNGVAFNSNGGARSFAGTTLQDRGYDRTFVADFIPVPEPTTSVFLATAVMTLVRRRQRFLSAAPKARSS
jgi:hypothetical protein